MKTYLTLIFPLFLLSSCGCKDTFNPIKEEEKKWIPYKNGERIQFLVNNMDTVEYSVEVTNTIENMSTGSYGSSKSCLDEIERMVANIKNPSVNIHFLPKSIEYFSCKIHSSNLSTTTSTLYLYSTKSSSEPDSSVTINGISYPVYNFLYDNKYHYLEKVTFSKDLGYLYVRDTAGNFISYIDRVQ
jgi:hypothetical protein